MPKHDTANPTAAGHSVEVIDTAARNESIELHSEIAELRSEVVELTELANRIIAHLGIEVDGEAGK